METMTFDLSNVYAISADQRTKYRHDGFVILRGAATPEEIAFYRPLIIDLVEQCAKTEHLQERSGIFQTLYAQVSNVWRQNDDVRALVHATRFSRLAAELMGVRSVRLYHDEALIKDPGANQSPWHKDHYNWPLATHHTIKLWLALSDIPLETGAIRFAAGTHRAGQFPELTPSYEADQLFNRIIRQHRVPVESFAMKAGDMACYAGELLHAALANASDARREALAIIYYEDGTRVMEPNHQNRRLDMEQFLPGLKPGDLAASSLNPLLFPEAV
jgi:ectoine hydroxylase-related dioxygenase (phytanoyl-CoA dioxygenase family)